MYYSERSVSNIKDGLSKGLGPGIINYLLYNDVVRAKSNPTPSELEEFDISINNRVITVIFEFYRPMLSNAVSPYDL